MADEQQLADSLELYNALAIIIRRSQGEAPTLMELLLGWAARAEDVSSDVVMRRVMNRLPAG